MLNKIKIPFSYKFSKIGRFVDENDGFQHDDCRFKKDIYILITAHLTARLRSLLSLFFRSSHGRGHRNAFAGTRYIITNLLITLRHSYLYFF